MDEDTRTRIEILEEELYELKKEATEQDKLEAIADLKKDFEEKLAELEDDLEITSEVESVVPEGPPGKIPAPITNPVQKEEPREPGKKPAPIVNPKGLDWFKGTSWGNK